MLLQQIKALLESVGSSFCPDYSDWYGTDGADIHSRNVDRSVVSKFLQAHPADYSTKKLQVSLGFLISYNLIHGIMSISSSIKLSSCASLYILAFNILPNYLDAFQIICFPVIKPFHV